MSSNATDALPRLMYLGMFFSGVTRRFHDDEMEFFGNLYAISDKKLTE